MRCWRVLRPGSGNRHRLTGEVHRDHEAETATSQLSHPIPTRDDVGESMVAALVPKVDNAVREVPPEEGVLERQTNNREALVGDGPRPGEEGPGLAGWPGVPIPPVAVRAGHRDDHADQDRDAGCGPATRQPQSSLAE